MQEDKYKDAALLIYELMQDTFGEEYSYFLGSPVMLAQSAYPCIVIQSISSNNTVQNAPTGHDVVSEQINIHILMSEMSVEQADDSIETTMRTLYNIVQGRDSTTGFYQSGTAMFALRTNLEFTNPITKLPTVVDHDIDINYDVTPTPGKPTIIEAILTLVTRERMPVPNRY